MVSSIWSQCAGPGMTRPVNGGKLISGFPGYTTGTASTCSRPRTPGGSRLQGCCATRLQTPAISTSWRTTRPRIGYTIASSTRFSPSASPMVTRPIMYAAVNISAMDGQWLPVPGEDERGMKLILDMVPNHCGVTNPWFLAAQADLAAPTADFFTFRQRPDDYVSWMGVRSLPKLNYRSERLREWMYAGKDAILRYWLRPPFRVDGWRLDVANMLARQGESQLDHKIGRGMRRAVKTESPHAYLFGENFYDGTPQLQGDELDAVMNYRGFSLPLLSWLTGFDIYRTWRPELVDPQPLPTEALAAQWRAFMSAVPWQIATQQFNLLGSHDTPRIATILDDDEARVRVAVTLLFTYPGVPSVYYGDEIGLKGGGDPDNRRCMPWDPHEWDADRREFYQVLMKLRRTSPALRQGGYQLLYASGDTLAFQREANEERLIVVARRGNDGLVALPVHHAGLPDGIHLRELLTGNETVVTNGMLLLDSLPPVGAQIWQHKL